MRISDWSSDVCSSDLQRMLRSNRREHGRCGLGSGEVVGERRCQPRVDRVCVVGWLRGLRRLELIGLGLECALGLERGDEEFPAGGLGARRSQQDGKSLRVGGEERKLLPGGLGEPRSEEHTSELQSLMRISYAVFCLKKKKIRN